MKYLLLKHYQRRPGPTVDFPPMDQWTPDEINAHIQFMRDFAARLEETGEFVDGQALAPDGALVPLRRRGQAARRRRPVRRDQGADRGLDDHRRRLLGARLELAGELSAAPGPGGEPIHEWLEVRPFLTDVRRPTERRWTSSSLREPRPAGDRCPRPARSRLRVGRGRRPGGARRGLADLAGRPAAGPEGLARHRRLAQVPRRHPLRVVPRAPARRRSSSSRAQGPTETPTTRCTLYFLCAHPSLSAPRRRSR